ncbi:MAG: SH3 domain-containing C40 family peptidase [Gemmatimonadota bacterium]
MVPVDSLDSRLVVLAAVLPVRAEASHRSEMVSQALCGEVVQILARNGGWYNIEMADGMRGWLADGGTRAVSRQDADAWQKSASSISLGTAVADVSGRQAATPLTAPWGAHLRPATDGRFEFPDGASWRPVFPESVISRAALAERFPPCGPDVVNTALLWLGTPYLWGGRTGAGADCSGFVQSVFRLHGIELPRDSGPQAECGHDVPVRRGEVPSLLAGDLMFFVSSDRSEQIGHVGISMGGSQLVHCSSGNGGIAVNDLAGDERGERGLLTRLARARRTADAG